MQLDVRVHELSLSQWERLRDIRLRALAGDPQAFGATLEIESRYGDAKWREILRKADQLIAVVDGDDIGTMAIENLDGDFGATCWIGGCWVDAAMRGQGVMRTFLEYLDDNAVDRNWTRQGLGVWHDNASAIGAYERLGFETIGGPTPSTRQPGKFYIRMFRDAVVRKS